MRLSPAAEFAVRGVLVLAENYGNGPVTLDTICRARGLSKQYLVKLFAPLIRAKLITPIRGKKGGYLLARPPKDITVLEVIEAVEGPIVLNFCQDNPPQCDRTGCPMRDVWCDLQETIRRKLKSMTFASCISAQAKKKA